jgi:hypothetical protein
MIFDICLAPPVFRHNVRNNTFFKEMQNEKNFIQSEHEVFMLAEQNF